MRIVINIERRNAKLSKDMNCKRTIKRIIMTKQFLNIFIFHRYGKVGRRTLAGYLF